MKLPMFRRWRTLLPMLFVLAMASCADYCSRQAFNKVVNERTETFAYSATPEQLWTSTQAELSQQEVKFDAAGPPLGAETVSPWRGKEGSRVRYHVKITKGSPSGHYLEITREEEETVQLYPDAGGQTNQKREPIGERVDVVRKRDLDTEWILVKKLDPKAAAEIEVAAAQRAEEVHDVVANGCQ